MIPVFYEHERLPDFLGGRIYLAGPTSRENQRTAWRVRALNLLARASAVVISPEFSDGDFDAHKEARFCVSQHGAEKILDWETRMMRRADVILFWMPFSDELPGFTTRCEFMREITARVSRVVAGMPPEAVHSSYIRYHAAKKQLGFHETLEETVAAARHQAEAI